MNSKPTPINSGKPLRSRPPLWTKQKQQLPKFAKLYLQQPYSSRTHTHTHTHTNTSCRAFTSMEGFLKALAPQNPTYIQIPWGQPLVDRVLGDGLIRRRYKLIRHNNIYIYICIYIYIYVSLYIYIYIWIRRRAEWLRRRYNVARRRYKWIRRRNELIRRRWRWTRRRYRLIHRRYIWIRRLLKWIRRRCKVIRRRYTVVRRL